MLKPQIKLAEELKKATDRKTIDRARARPKSAEAEVEQDREKKFENIEANPFAQITRSKEGDLRKPSQKRDAMIKLLSYDKTKSIEENESLVKAYMVFLEFMEEESLATSKENIADQNVKVFAELKKVIDEFSRGLLNFKEEIGPFTRRLEAIYNIRLSGKAVALLEEIITDRRSVEENKKLLTEQTADLESSTTKLNNLTDVITSEQRRIARLGQDYRLGMSFMGIRGESQQEISDRELTLGKATAKASEVTAAIEGLKARIAETKDKIGTPVGTKFGELASDKAELQGMLDISNEEHMVAHQHLKDTTMAFIETAETRMDSVLDNVAEVNSLTRKTSKRNAGMTLVSAIMNEAVKTSLGNNQAALTEYQPPEDPSVEDEIAKAEREEVRGAILRHIKTVMMADDDTTKLRNTLTRQKDQLEAMMSANEERIRSTKQLRTSGISNMASEMAVTMTALADAANSEAIYMSQSMVDAMGQTVIDIRSKEVMRHASEMGMRTQQLAELIISTQQANRIARVSIEEQKKSLIELNKSLSDVTDVTASLQETLTASESVYADAQAAAAEELAERGPLASNDNPSAAGKRRKTGTAGPSPDFFG